MFRATILTDLYVDRQTTGPTTAGLSGARTSAAHRQPAMGGIHEEASTARQNPSVRQEEVPST